MQEFIPLSPSKETVTVVAKKRPSKKELIKIEKAGKTEITEKYEKKGKIKEIKDTDAELIITEKPQAAMKLA